MEEKQKKSIFRQSSLNRVSTPEEMDRYLQVTGPGIWMTLIAVIVLLIGVFAWLILGHLDTKLPVAVYAENGSLYCWVPSDQAEAIQGKTVEINGENYPITDAGLSLHIINTEDVETHMDRLIAGGAETGVLNVGTSVRIYKVEADLPANNYDGQIVVESVNPITFIIN